MKRRSWPIVLPHIGLTPSGTKRRKVSTNIFAAAASSISLVRTRSMQHVFYEEPASAEETRRMLAEYLSR